MEIFDAFHLARLQFAFTVSIHIVFPAISIGMASFLAVLEWRYLVIGDAAYQAMFQFWSKIFAIGFGMGVGTVIVLPVILVYNAMQYRVFRGKVREGDAGYH